MTTNDTIPAPPGLPNGNSASLPTTTPGALVVLEPKVGLLRQAIGEAGLDGEDIENLAIVSRMAFDTDNVWAVGASPPNHPELHVVAIFEGSQADLNDTHVPGDLRAYVAPLALETGQTPTMKLWRRYTLSRAVTTAATMQAMTQDRFVSELAAEFEALAGVHDATAAENEALREALEAIAAKAGETTTPAVVRLQEIEKIVEEALAGDEEEEVE